MTPPCPPGACRPVFGAREIPRRLSLGEIWRVACRRPPGRRSMDAGRRGSPLMKAVRLHTYDKRPVVEDVPEPEVTGPLDVLVEIGGAGLCRTDLHIER